jgi:ribonuclease VapC
MMAIVLSEPDSDKIIGAILGASITTIPAPVLTELWLVSGGRGTVHREFAEDLLTTLFAGGVEIAPFEHRHADITATARDLYGRGNGKGGLLNFGDLMVYAIAKDRGQPLLCTGRDFATTDLVLHPASRIDP